jgi:hypothetical protein
VGRQSKDEMPHDFLMEKNMQISSATPAQVLNLINTYVRNTHD